MTVVLVFFAGVLVGCFVSALCVMAKSDDEPPRPPVRSWINDREVGATSPD
jgi:uncharacterized protein YneF (UPF0154 family)